MRSRLERSRRRKRPMLMKLIAEMAEFDKMANVFWDLDSYTHAICTAHVGSHTGCCLAASGRHPWLNGPYIDRYAVELTEEGISEWMTTLRMGQTVLAMQKL